MELLFRKDSGPGYRKMSLPFIWERFYKVIRPERVKRRLVGIGIVKKIIEVHDGRVWAQNCSEGGTASSFYTEGRID